MSRYRGFSTVGRRSKFRLKDYELAKQDLINHLQISKGEKLMDPDFGSNIWAMIFENKTQTFRNEILAEVSRVVAYDPRLRLTAINLTEFEHGIQIDMDIIYTGEVSPVRLQLAFETDTTTVREI